MVSVTVSVPEETKQIMDAFPEMNWSGFVRKSVEEKAKELAWREEMLKKLKGEEAFTKWTVAAGREAKKGRFKELLSKLPPKEREMLLKK